MQFELKPITHGSIEKSLGKAHRYRLLNEPSHTESICRDVLLLEPDNQQAINILLLALTDQFEKRLTQRYKEAMALLPRFEDQYRQVYYNGLIRERRGLALYKRGGPGAGYVAYEWLRQAMEYYEEAIPLSEEGNDDAILRWNTCARLIMENPEIEPEPAHANPHMLE